jgi:hypothetical protein
MSIWRKYRGRLFMALAVLPVTVPVALVLKFALTKSELLNPIGEALGLWLGDNISPSKAQWIVIIVLTLCLYVAALVFIAWLPTWWAQRKSMRFVFPNEAGNLESKTTNFRMSYKIYPEGEPYKTKLTLQQFYVGVENLTNATLRNVRFVIESVTLPPRPTELHCYAKRTNQTSIDIQPRATELFLIGEGYDSSDGAGVIIRQPGEVDVLVEHAAITRFYLGTASYGPFPLLRNDGYVISFSAYADDVAAINAEAVLNTKKKIELRLTKGPNVLSLT